MPVLLIMTVGTGTAGTHSNLAAGLCATIKSVSPRKYWLVPSSAPDSVAIADLLSEEFPENFAPVSDVQKYFVIPAPDDIFSCRSVMRQAIAYVRQFLAKGEKLLLNPTSGTKQMSAGATLAALDEEIGDLIFTVGERVDGVVKTGTERVVDFSTHAFFLERDLRSACLLCKNGAFSAAVRLMEKHAANSKVAAALRKAQCLNEWQRLNYNAAAATAAAFDQSLAGYFRNFYRALQNNNFLPEMLADFMVWADYYVRLSDGEEALIWCYRSLEYAFRMRATSRELKEDVFYNGIRNVINVLADEYNDPMAQNCRVDGKIQKLISVRNNNIHSIRPVDIGNAQSFFARLCNLFSSHIQNWCDLYEKAPKPSTLIASF